MKRLTINRIASAGLRANRKSYLSLAVGIFLSIFLISGLCLSIQGLLLAQRQKITDRMGYAEMALYASELTNEELREYGFFDEIGSIAINATVAEQEIWLGSYDETAQKLMNRKMISGRMPEAAGEIAVEEYALELLGVEPILGESIRLNLLPLGGVSEARTFTLVGVLKDQSHYYDLSGNFQSGYGVNTLPAILTWSEEPGFETGYTSLQRVMTPAPGWTSARVDSAADEDHPISGSGALVFVNAYGDLTWEISELNALNGPAGISIVMLIILACALLLACCTGISGALESQLSRKSEEIGMLRAVGATRRQIRKVFGREAWLLAVLVSPVSLGLSCLFVWLFSIAYPAEMIFRPSAIVIVPVLILSVLVILIASGLPLQRASRTTPMQTIRDTAILRKTRRVKNSKHFNVPSLISWRQVSLHPTRLLAPALLIGLSMVVVMLTGILAMDTSINYYKDLAEFRMYKHSTMYPEFMQCMETKRVTEADINQILSTNNVIKVDAYRQGRLCMLLDEAPAYFLADRETGFMLENEYLTDAENYRAAEHNRARQALGTDRLLVEMDLAILDPSVGEWQEWIDQANEAGLIDGEIDLAALDSGKEVLVFAPDYYVEKKADGGRIISTNYNKNKKYDYVRKNDYFKAGMQLDLAQIVIDEARYEESFGDSAVREVIYQEGAKTNASVSVGGMLSKRQLPENVYFWDPGILTTLKGAQALGLYTGDIQEMDIYTRSGMTIEEEEAVEERLEVIANRCNMGVSNYLRSARETEKDQKQLTMVLSAVLIVFFAVSVAQVAGNISRNIRADGRKIGLLRAVGADKRMLAKCYSGQVWLSVGLGAIIGAVLILILWQFDFLIFFDYDLTMNLILVGATIAFLLAAAVTCLSMLRMRIREATNKSIIENIREL